MKQRVVWVVFLLVVVSLAAQDPRIRLRLSRMIDHVAAVGSESGTSTGQDSDRSGPHGYFNELVARGDCYRAFSFRPQAGVASANTGRGVADCSKPRAANQLQRPNGSASLFMTYSPGTDAHPHKQDALKVVIPQFYPNHGYAISNDVDAVTTLLPLNQRGPGENRRAIRIGDEIVEITGRWTGTAWPVVRGAWGTKPAAHSRTTPVAFSVNGHATSDQVRTLVETDGSQSAKYLFTADIFYTDSFVGTGLNNHKTLMITFIADGNQFIETNASYNGPLTRHAPNPEWLAKGGSAKNVASFHVRCYGQSTAVNARQDGPCLPMANPPFIIKPNKWTRLWIMIEANAETDTTKFAALSGGRAPLAAAIPDATTTSITIDVTGVATNPFTACPYECSGQKDGRAWTGRALKIDNEIMTLVGCTVCKGTSRTITVVRGAQGTNAAAHSAGTQVQVIDDFLTIWVADEDQAPALMYDRAPWHIPLNHHDPRAAGSLYNFWVEFNTSSGEIVQGRADAGFQDMVAYVRNLVILKNPPADWSALRVKPVR